MLNWLLRRKRDRAIPAATPAAAPAAPRPAIDPDLPAWEQRLRAAAGDDAALLELARQAPLLAIKQAAVEALSGETALRQAEREFRTHDRKVHQRARQRLAAAVALREARARADALIEAARSLLDVRPVAANRLAALDRDWQALAAPLLDLAQRDAFAQCRERLDAALQSEADAQAAARRAAAWQAEADELQAALASMVASAELPLLESALARADSTLAARPPAAGDPAGLQAAASAARAALAAAAETPEPPPAPPLAPAPAPAPATTARVAVVDRTPPADALAAIEALLLRAEEALTEGRTGALQQPLQAIDDALAAWPRGAAMPEPMRARWQLLQAEWHRLKGWRQWGGAVAREALVDEAEALARQTAAAQAEPPTAKLNLKDHGEAIRRLRARWKELDRSGAAAGPTLWQRFDGALTLAHAPVAAQQAALKAAREDNLAAREALIIELDAAAARAASPRETLQALEVFRQAWRKLGPPEHTVPAASLGGLQQRVEASLARAEAPLLEARAAAARDREALVAQAEALAAQDARDAAPRLRELQALWQQQARTLPLARPVEAALWSRFRQATDAVFARREAALQARVAEAAAAVAAREALLGRLAALAAEASTSAATERALDPIDREWRQAPTALPRPVAEALEGRYRAARAAVAQAIEARRLAQWQAACDALRERLALCEAREAGVEADGLLPRWQAAGDLPRSWREVLEVRWARPPAAPPGDGVVEPTDELLLRCEDALGLAPAPAQAAARRELKLRAMKEALEGRAASRATDATARPAAWLGRLLAQGGLDAAQRERLHAVLDALRRDAPPGWV